MTTLLFFAFLSGLVTIAAPCIWPLLPIILSSSVIGTGHKRPLGITIGILVSFGILTLTISYLVSFFKFDPNILRYFAVFILLFLGATMVIPPLTRIVESFVSRFVGKLAAKPGEIPSSGFLPGFITGLSLGVVWTPCAGPILATIATLAATRTVNLEIILVTVVYLIGVGIPLFLFAYAGQKFIAKSRFLNKYTGNIQKVFGVIIILTAFLILTNYDKVLQAKLLDVFPAYSQFVVDLESNDTVTEALDRIGGKEEDMSGKAFNPMNSQENSIFNANVPAPEITGISNWLNSEPLTLESLKGKVVLIDFWTYTCINCIRTLPHVTSWYEKYKDDGLVIIGVHTPEFEFEKNTDNVQGAIEQFGITYPVAQDNDFGTWRAFSNRYWPAKYLIDKNGNIRYYHFGEGKYDETERAIQLLLQENGKAVTKKIDTMPDMTPTQRVSPETYLGSSRMEYLYPNGSTKEGEQNFTIAKNISENSFTFGGVWDIQNEYAKSVENAVLEYKFFAKNVFLVMRPGKSSGKVRVILDGKEVSLISVDADKLYELIQLSDYEAHLLRLEFTPGIEAFAFTFG